jgi:hypothetical protein
VAPSDAAKPKRSPRPRSTTKAAAPDEDA